MSVIATQTICPICSAAASHAWSKSGYDLMECTSCSHLFCECGQASDYVQTTYSDAYFQNGGGGYDDYLEHQDILFAQGKKYAARLGGHVQPGRVLDVGAAAGFLLKGFVDGGWDGVGIEPNPAMARHANEFPGVHVHTGTLEEASYLKPKSFDAATFIQVISHLRRPTDGLNRIHQLLRDDGLLLIETWNRAGWTARALGKHWHQYNPPSVLHWYTPKHLTSILNRCGFQVIDRGRPTKWISVGNGASLLRHSMRESTVGRIATSPLSLVPKSLKAPYFLDDVFWLIAKKIDA